ncbi:retrovirus-related pol polyprotein from transposon TNT 1-94, partial [Tanacetum coccineum]
AYADVRAKNQDLFITISELKNKLKTVDKGKNVDIKFDKSEASGTLLCVTPLPKNIAIKDKKVSKTKVNADRNSNVKIALFTTPVAAKSKTLGGTFVVAKSRLSVANTLKARNKSHIRVRSTSNTSVTTQKWVAKLSTLPSAFVSCDAGTVRFGNDHFAAITGYGDYVQGNLMICHVYYVEGLEHNLFSVTQFCDGDLEVAFRLNTCYVRNLEGDDFLTGSHDSNLYTISISEMAASSPVCLMSRATSTKSRLWHHRLSHLNFGTINQLTSKDLVDGLLKFKYNKDHLYSAYEQGKSKKASLLPKLVPSTESKLKLLHIDLCGPMRVAS